MPKEYLGQGICGCHSLPACSLGASAASQTFTLSAVSYWHWTSTSLHSIGFINSLHFFSFFFQVDFFKVLCGHVKALPGHLKGPLALQPHQSETPSLFIPVRLPPWENVNRSTTLIYRMWVTSTINYSWKKLRDFVDVVFPTLSKFANPNLTHLLTSVANSSLL